MIKVEHIGIAVKNIEQVNALYTKLFNQEPYKEERKVINISSIMHRETLPSHRIERG